MFWKQCVFFKVPTCTQTVGAIAEKMQKDFAKLMGDPVGKEFSKSGGNATVVVVQAPKKEAVGERAASCKALAKIDADGAKEAAQECDSLVKQAVKATEKALENAPPGFKLQPPKNAETTVMERATDVCNQVGGCEEKISEIKAKLTALKMALNAEVATEAAKEGATGSTGATGADDKEDEKKGIEKKDDEEKGDDEKKDGDDDEKKDDDEKEDDDDKKKGSKKKGGKKKKSKKKGKKKKQPRFRGTTFIFN